MDADITVWLSGQQIIMKGVDIKTTCGEVIETLVSKPCDAWTMVERWKGVERPLAHRQRILQVWNQWANDKHQVKLAIKKQEEKKIKKRRTERHNVERLLKLILAQGETIQNRLQVLSTREDKEHTSSSAEPSSTDSNQEQSTSQLIRLYEKITKINKRIEKQEEILLKLHIQINKHFEKDKSIIVAKIKQLKLQNETNYVELESNLDSLNKTDVYINEKTEYLQSLYKELHQRGLETSQLIEIKDMMESEGKNKQIGSDDETNSDTGLSSLHSSSEEGNFIIESAL